MLKIQKRIVKLSEDMDKEIESMIKEARRDYIIPFCLRTGYRFTSGMGSWSFDRKGRHGQIWINSFDPEGLPKRVLQILSTEHPLNRSNDIGSLMQDFTPPNWERHPRA